jgi:phosphatidylinositol alpha-mannosyltransferase
MNIVQVTQSYHPRPGGVTEHVHHVSEQLRRRGHTVTVVTADFGNGADHEAGVVRIGKNVLVPINGAWVNMTVGAQLYRDLERVLKRLHPDVIHTHCPLAPTLPLMTLRAAPTTSRVVGTFHAAAQRSRWYQFFKSPLARLACRLDARIAVSQAALDLVDEYVPGEYTIVPNGVDCKRFSPSHKPLESLRDDAFNVLFVGRMDKRKGLKYLFHAISSLSSQVDRRIRLIIVGDDGLRRRLLPRLPASVDVVFTGVIPNHLLPRYFASGDVFCSPATDRESFGIVLLEAMASGVPVIGTGIPGYLTILRDRWNSIVVPPRDSASLSVAIRDLMTDEPLRRKLRNNALSFVRTYDWENVVDGIEAVYQRWHTPECIEPATNSSTMQQSVRAQKA